MKYYALIPAYCPDNRLVQICQKIRDLGFRVVVVNDGSPEQFSNIFQNLEIENIEVLTHRQNRGKGEALKSGLIYIDSVLNSQEEFAYIATLDADGQHDPDDVLKCLEVATLLHENASSPILVLGSRFHEKSDIPLRSRIGNSLMRTLFSFRTNVKINDTQTGLRVFSNDLLPIIIETPGSRYDYEMNVLLKCADSGVLIKEAPIRTIYEDNNESSHFHAVKDSWLIILQFLKFSLSSFSSFIIDYALYVVLIFFLGASYVVVANIIARIISATCNYLFNSYLVFKNVSQKVKTASEYVALAVVILALNTIALVALASIGVDVYIAKIIAEAVLFIVNFLVQKFFIFKKAGNMR